MNDNKFEHFEDDSSERHWLKHCQDELQQIEKWMRENVRTYHTPEGHANSENHLFWNIVSHAHEESKEQEKKARQDLVARQRWLRKNGYFLPLVHKHDVPEFSSHKEIAKYAQWNHLVYDYASDEHLKKEIEFEEEHPSRPYVVDQIYDWWAREINRLSWKDDAPEILKPIQADLLFSNGNYTNVYLETRGGDNFLSVEYRAKDGLSYRSFDYDGKHDIYEVLNAFYKDIFIYLTSLKES